MKKTIVIASNNKHKIEEFKEMFNDYKILAMKDMGFVADIVEDGKTFLENALIKAKTINKYLKEQNINACVIADDSGLYVSALNGEPGIFSARYAGENATSAQNRKFVLNKLKNHKDRSAYFHCCIVKIFSDGKYIVGEGKTYGHITDKELGDRSFGYDCIFYSDDLNKTFGQATSEEKNAVSHRGRAIKDLLKNNNLKKLLTLI